ncbi:MAG: transporter substrate-binding domain-containing protein [Pseudanabaenaceae cyanobacterium]
MRRVWILGVIGVLGATWPARADGSLALMRRRGVLRIGFDASLGAPYVFWNPETRYYDGFEWELAQEIARQLQVEARPVNAPWALHGDRLLRREVDVVINNRERGALGDRFGETVPYYRSTQRILTRSDLATRIRGLPDLTGKRVGLIPKSGGAALAETYNQNRGNALRLFANADLARLLNQLRNRQLDALLLDEPLAVWHSGRDRQLTLVGQPLLPVDLVALTHKDDGSLRQAVSSAIVRLREEGKLEAILRRWKLW